VHVFLSAEATATDRIYALSAAVQICKYTSSCLHLYIRTSILASPHEFTIYENVTTFLLTYTTSLIMCYYTSLLILAELPTEKIDETLADAKNVLLSPSWTQENGLG
jgi:hypothetical protein